MMQDTPRTPLRSLALAAVVTLGAALLPSALAQGADGGELGETTYNTVCMACHQMNGQGLPGVYPSIIGNPVRIYGVEGSREYLAKLMLYGLQGEVNIDGATYNQLMTGQEMVLDDAQIAAVLNYVMHAFGNAEALPEDYEPFTAEEIAPYRGQGLTAADVYALRGELGIDAVTAPANE